MDVSRSGRIRKKSTKLADFESSAEIDLALNTPTSGKKKAKEGQGLSHTVMTTSSQQIKNPSVFVDELPPDQLLADDQNNLDGSGNEYFGDSSSADPNHEQSVEEEDFDIDIDIKEEDFENIPYVADDDEDFDEGRNVDVEDDGNSDDSDEGNLMIDDSRGAARNKAKSKSNRPMTSSIYLSEKAGIGGRKPAGNSPSGGRNRVIRRDKGTRRITAFMLWAKHMRKDVVDANPRMDFSTISKKLGEIWATVSTSEKYTWKKRAKRLSTKEANAKASAPQNNITVKHTTGATSMRSAISSSQRRTPQSGMSSPTYSRAPEQTTTSSSSNFKAVGTQPLDSAAHLKLLGESLSVIGERLTEHEGQIAVSGSLSVLLDSLLCALGPLVCLTQQVPELNVVPQETLSRTLDNIAYIMPGL